MSTNVKITCILLSSQIVLYNPEKFPTLTNHQNDSVAPTLNGRLPYPLRKDLGDPVCVS